MKSSEDWSEGIREAHRLYVSAHHSKLAGDRCRYMINMQQADRIRALYRGKPGYEELGKYREEILYGRS